jgi:hypothetical protein
MGTVPTATLTSQRAWPTPINMSKLVNSLPETLDTDGMWWDDLGKPSMVAHHVGLHEDHLHCPWVLLQDLSRHKVPAYLPGASLSTMLLAHSLCLLMSPLPAPARRWQPWALALRAHGVVLSLVVD